MFENLFFDTPRISIGWHWWQSRMTDESWWKLDFYMPYKNQKSDGNYKVLYTEQHTENYSMTCPKAECVSTPVIGPWWPWLPCPVWFPSKLSMIPVLLKKPKLVASLEIFLQKATTPLTLSTHKIYFGILFIRCSYIRTYKYRPKW